MSGRSVNLTTLFLGGLKPKRLTSTQDPLQLTTHFFEWKSNLLSVSAVHHKANTFALYQEKITLNRIIIQKPFSNLTHVL